MRGTYYRASCLHHGVRRGSRPIEAAPEARPCGGLGQPPKPAYPHPPANLRQLALASAGQIRPVTWRQGTKATRGNPTAAMASQFLARLAPARHPRRPRPGVHHHDQDRPKSPCAGMTLYQVLHELQIVLALILGACPLCTQPLTLDGLAAALAGT
jgi:hypothetical protein